ncbi:Flagellar sensor histidine kinase FleS [Paramagnetospirillum magnetotacticum MS-1]|uniref:histidine kinase n=1 Tax=Paramagnetospirillum magnetotacticum MS-1 TaxID=272627 RepID=A0A0C2U5H4_PARME|nr:ATP-binding protein [Paramagnetospirillum magnetotacticum]KIL96692.1 Flagellar sensor histidine kinase FleS [Paramagnetospirillum magnetotacticum MS-1]
MKTSRKIFGLTYLIAGMAVAGIALFTLSRTTQTLHDLSRQRLHESVNREARIIYNTLDMVKSDLLVLAEEGGAGGSLDEASRRKLSDRYATFMQKRPSYTRILYQSGTNGDLVSVEQTDQGLRAKGTGAAVDSDLSHMAEQGAKLWPGNVILTDMLDFARPKSLDLDWVDLDEVLEIATVSMTPMLTEQDIVVCTDGHHSLPKVWGDRTRLIQVFQNLLSNAIQAMERGGHLTLEARSELHRSRPSVEIRIIDTGSGISVDVRDKIFEPFFTTRAKGTGLGLTIVHRLIRSHDGELIFESNPVGGTVARVILPLVSPDWPPSSMTQISLEEVDAR